MYMETIILDNYDNFFLTLIQTKANRGSNLCECIEMNRFSVSKSRKKIITKWTNRFVSIQLFIKMKQIFSVSTEHIHYNYLQVSTSLYFIRHLQVISHGTIAFMINSVQALIFVSIQCQ